MRSALLLAAIALALPAPAHATTGTAAGMLIGQQVWGLPPCGQPHVEVSTPTEYLREHGTGVFDSAPVAWADDARCVIVINPDQKIHTAAKRCHVIVHEWGHLAGYRDPSNTEDPEHSDNPRSVMYGEDLVSEGRYWFTKKRFRWVAGGAFKPCYSAVDNGNGIG